MNIYEDYAASYPHTHCLDDGEGAYVNNNKCVFLKYLFIGQYGAVAFYRGYRERNVAKKNANGDSSWW